MPKKEVAMSSEFSLERITQLVSDLEQELLAAPPGSAKLDALREEIAVLKRTLEQPEGSSGELSDHLQGVRGRLSEVLANVEGEALKDTPYLVEMGRILGLV
ncbi:MAG: hypothetical protein H9535_12700 [Ignavibacteria bacterium]|jgi:hypothetical protein|nr:hypothetical protein [Ignavibacteria bacterium]